MNGALASIASLLVAYLIGSIPFGYVLVRAIAGVDVRTIGSGNTGATNASRVLGARFFPVIFVLDAAKGFVPTFFFPRLVAHWTGSAVPDLAPLVALATILGHNFPIYLGFKGGKGAATSFGAVLALDLIATAFAAFGAVIFLAFTRFVSMASLGGGLVFVLTHFARTPDPFGAGQRTTSALILALMALLLVRHRTNLARIAAGTEPKVTFRKKRAPEGKVRAGLVVLLVVIAGGTGLVVNASRRPELTVAGRRFVEVSRYAPGHQRAERLAFLDGGKLLVATCPRYLRVVLARITDAH
ncbi:MAG TPA: glycerol-3-phosphate 1-O-acyltransferase PlsY, partial [Isosphaeraceae bacterium]